MILSMDDVINTILPPFSSSSDAFREVRWLKKAVL